MRYVIDVSNGTVAQTVDYDEYGVVEYNSNPGFTPFGFAGGMYDYETGLVRFGVRDYDAESGRWTCKDPIGLNGSVNFYRYCKDDPLNNVDPFGLQDDGSSMETSQGTYTTAEIQVLKITENESGMKIIDRYKIEIEIPTTVFTRPDDEPIIIVGDHCGIVKDETSIERTFRNISKLIGPKEEVNSSGQGGTFIRN